MNLLIFDIEGNSLKPDIIWCLAAMTPKGVRSTTDYEKMKQKLLEAPIIIGHNITRFDVPVLERILGIKIKAKIVDTLALSWSLFPERNQHGLEEWGEDLGIKKPEIIVWDDPNLLPEYIHRCEEDVKINTKLWNKIWKLLMRLYDDDEKKAWEYIDYISFKMDCAREQERSKWKLDIDTCKKAFDELSLKKEEATLALIEVMPKVPQMVKKSRPSKPFKKDGSYSEYGARWFHLLRQNNLPEDYDGVVEVVNGYEDGNPASNPQLKKWLFDCGWKPITFKYKKEDDGTTRKIPQINLEHGGGICPSVQHLYEHHPEFKLLEGLGVVSHRVSILAGFLDNVDPAGFVPAQISGLTNTLRFKHKTIVNLPKVGKLYAKDIRGSLIAPEGMELCGSDMSGLEDRLKQHYIYPHDPDFVNEMLADDYDPHLSLAVLAKRVTEEGMATYKWYASLKDDEKKVADVVRVNIAKEIKPIRDIFKNGNYACQYGAGPPRLALTANISLKEAEFVHATYWKKNWAIKVVAEEQEVKTVNGTMWLKNPINGFYYWLKQKKDIFSTLVQGSASYVFDLWVMEFRKKRSQLTAQFHDEVVLCVKIGYRKPCETMLRDAIKAVNDNLKLNRELGIDVQFGSRYSDIH